MMSDDALASVKLTRIRVGELNLPDGRLVATDPLTMPERPPFARTVAAGSYPVFAIREIASGRIALAYVLFSSEQPKTWELAVIPGQDVSTLKDNEYFGIAVDTGLVAFTSSRFAAAVVERENRIKTRDGEFDNYYDDVLADELPDGTEFILHHPLPDAPEIAAAIVHSGWGDGFYPVLWGLTSAGDPAIALADFDVVSNSDGRSEYDKKTEFILAGMSAERRQASTDAYEALKTGDLAKLCKLLELGLVTPDSYVVGAGGSFLWEAIRLDKPASVALMMDFGATDSLPQDIYGDRDAKTYSDFARVLQSNVGKRATPDLPPLAPRSPELMRLIEVLESGKKP